MKRPQIVQTALLLLGIAISAAPAIASSDSSPNALAKWKTRRLENSERRLLEYITGDSAKEKGLLIDTIDPKNRFMAIIPLDPNYESFVGVAWQHRDSKITGFPHQPLLLTLIRAASPFSAMPDHVEVVDELTNPKALLEHLRNGEGRNDLSATPVWHGREEQERVENEIIERLQPHTISFGKLFCRDLFWNPPRPKMR